jgi:hypothetical protein
MKIMLLFLLLMGSSSAFAIVSCQEGSACGVSGCPSTFICGSAGCKLCMNCKESGNDITKSFTNGTWRISCGDIHAFATPSGAPTPAPSPVRPKANSMQRAK